jgi:hypothetical protein
LSRKRKLVSNLCEHDNMIYFYFILKLACDWNSEQRWNSFCALHKAPGAREVLGSHPLQYVHLRRVDEAAQEYSVDPHEQNIAVVALDSAQSQKRYTW